MLIDIYNISEAQGLRTNPWDAMLAPSPGGLHPWESYSCRNISKLPFSAPDSQDTPRDSRTHRTHRTHRPPVHQTPQALQSATEPTGPTGPQCTRHPRHYRVLQTATDVAGTRINRGVVVLYISRVQQNPASDEFCRVMGTTL
jgi:hypothetical protein